MKLASSGFPDNGKIPAEFAFCAPDAKTRVPVIPRHPTTGRPWTSTIRN